MPAGPWRPIGGADCDTELVSTYTQLPPAAGATRERSAGAKALLAVGVVMAVLGGAMALIGFGLMADGADSIIERADQVRDGLEIEVDVPGRGTVDLDEETYTIYVLDPYQVSTTGPDAETPTTLSDGGRRNDSDPIVRVLDPDGREVPQRAPGINSVTDSGSVVSVGRFSAAEAGTYTVEVTGGDADRIGIGPASDGARLLARTLGGGVLGLIGLGVGGLGALLAIGGLVWLLTSGGPPRPLPMPTPVSPGWGPPPTVAQHPGPDHRPPPPVPPGGTNR